MYEGGNSIMRKIITVLLFASVWLALVDACRTVEVTTAEVNTGYKDCSQLQGDERLRCGAHNLQVCGEAHDAKIAYKLVSKTRPDPHHLLYVYEICKVGKSGMKFECFEWRDTIDDDSIGSIIENTAGTLALGALGGGILGVWIGTSVKAKVAFLILRLLLLHF